MEFAECLPYIEIFKDGDESNEWDTDDTSEYRVPKIITPRHLKGDGYGVTKVMFDQGKCEIVMFQVNTRLDEFQMTRKGMKQKIAPEGNMVTVWVKLHETRTNYIRFLPGYKLGCKAFKAFYNKFGTKICKTAHLQSLLTKRLGCKSTKVLSGTLIIDDFQKRYDFINVVTFANIIPSKGIAWKSISNDVLDFFKGKNVFDSARVHDLQHLHALYIEFYDKRYDRKWEELLAVAEEDDGEFEDALIPAKYIKISNPPKEKRRSKDKKKKKGNKYYEPNCSSIVIEGTLKLYTTTFNAPPVINNNNNNNSDDHNNTLTRASTTHFLNQHQSTTDPPVLPQTGSISRHNLMNDYIHDRPNSTNRF